MSSAESIRQLEERAQGFVPEAEERRPVMFLSLAPTTSASYPRHPRARVSNTATVPLTSGALAKVPELSPKRRTSSMSSDGNKSASGFRFLKLGPVHYGEHLDEDQEDWSDAAVE